MDVDDGKLAEIVVFVDKIADMAFGAADIVLSEVHHALHASFLSLYPHLFRICPTGYLEAWTFQGLGFGYLANIKMQSMGWFGL